MRNDEKIRILKLATRYPEGSIERRALTRLAKFEEGKPADPTKNMSPEAAAEWKSQTEQNKDNLKEAALRTSITKLASSFPKGSLERSSLLKLLSES